MIQGFSGGLLNRQLIYNLDLPSFQRDFASLKTLDHGTGPAITFTRASGATYFDVNGVLQTAANDVARFDHSQDGAANSLGLLIEESRTNSLRNSQGGGSTVGTHTGGTGAGGVLPTNWIWTGGGLDLDVVGTGTEDGLSYIDIRFYGTTNTVSAALGYEAQSQIVAADGQTWTASHYVRTVAGDLTNITQVSTQIRMNSGSSQLAAHNVGFTPSASYQRATSTTTIANASVDRVVERIALSFSSGVAIDLTLRIAAPQLELGAFPTSYIPTTTAAATRSADSAVVTPISGFYNQAEGTVFAESSSSALVAGDNQGIWGFGDDTLAFASGRTLYAVYDTNRSHRIAVSGIGATTRIISLNNTGVAQSANVVARSIFSCSTSGCAISTNGADVATDSVVDMPLVTGFSIGGLQKAWSGGANHLNGHIRKIAYYPKRLTNALLEQLTT